MFGEILHVGVTVTDLERSIAFYRDVLGMNFVGKLTMEGEATDRLFGRKNCRAEVGYLKGGPLEGPPVELIAFTSEQPRKEPTDLFTTSISEICFRTDDIWEEYRRLSALGVEFLSEPQSFDFTGDGFGKSIAVYLRDPDGVILELIQEM